MKEQFKKINSSATAVALGFFDGIHLGHKAVINSMLSCAKENNLTPALYTFKKSPAQLFGKSAPSLSTNEERYSILKNMGVEIIFEDDFFDIKDMTPKEFVQKVLVDRFCAKNVFCGFNYHFGKGGNADSNDLIRICAEYGIGVTVAEPVIIGDEPVSSTRIRNLLTNGRIEEANTLLDHMFGYSSVIEEGNHIGRLMETPTINQKLPQEMILPKFGVYTSVVTVTGKEFAGVTNIGVKPTVGEYSPLSETWLPDYVGNDLYGEKIDIRLMCFHRAEKKFSSIDELQKAIVKDGQLALSNYSKYHEMSKK